jgi:hypothetical protein
MAKQQPKTTVSPGTDPRLTPRSMIGFIPAEKPHRHGLIAATGMNSTKNIQTQNTAIKVIRQTSTGDKSTGALALKIADSYNSAGITS